ncbi:MAG TPA: hypothetical protein VFE99_07470 [Agromyces sp.]|nr:hypothetical protein [Agromyces sp.]
MTTHADDQPLLGFGASAADDAPRAGRRSADVGGTLRPRRIPAPEWGRHPHPSSRDVQRYYLVSEEPSGEFVEVIIPVTDGGRRRYFATSDGERLTEVDEDYFVGRGEGNARSLLELDPREMAELQAELNFVRPVLGRDPLAEAAEHVASETTDDSESPDDAWETDAPEQAYGVAMPVAAVAPHISPPPAVEEEPAAVETPQREDYRVPAEPREPLEPPDAMDDSALDEPAALENQVDDDHEAEAEDDEDEETIEESDVVMGSSVFEEVEPVASVPPVDVPPVSVPASTDAPTHAAPHAHAAPDTTPAFDAAVDAAAQVSLAKGIAFVAHRGQLDLVGAEYIDHPGRVAERFDPLTEPVPTAVAWLHDVLEDTAVTAQELLEAGVLPEIVELVQLLTRTAGVADHEYYARIRRNPVALRVKLAHLDDDTAPWRVRRLDYDEQLRLAEKSRHARELLSE